MVNHVRPNYSTNYLGTDPSQTGINTGVIGAWFAIVADAGIFGIGAPASPDDKAKH